MADLVLEALMRQLLEWLSDGEQPYESVMTAWRTSCPRLPVWEDAIDGGLITTQKVNGLLIVTITPAGLNFLDRRHQSGG